MASVPSLARKIPTLTEENNVVKALLLQAETAAGSNAYLNITADETPIVNM